MEIAVDKKVEILFKEYDSLRSEILDRMKIAFSHLGYVGALVAFGAPFVDDIPRSKIWIGVVGFAILSWISAINWMWLRNCSAQLRELEERINACSGETLLTWEGRAKGLTKGVLKFPRPWDSLVEPKWWHREMPAPNPRPPADAQARR